MRKNRKETLAQCQLFPPTPTNLPTPANISPRLIHLLVKLLRNAADHRDGQPRALDGNHE
jgi:hypothetical protein